MDIILINPGHRDKHYLTEHLGIAILKAYVVSKGFIADTLDLAIEAISLDQCIDKIIPISPKIVGVSLLDATKSKGLALIQRLRKSGYSGKIIIGGYFATFSAYELLRDFPEIDFVVRGEGEFTLAEVLSKIIYEDKILWSEIKGLSYREREKIIENPARSLVKNLDLLPPVDRKYAWEVLKSGTPLRIYSSRGCWGSCTFCDIVGLYGQSPGKVWRRRSVIHLVDEIESLVNTYQTHYFIFNDDQFLIKGKRSQELINMFAAELEYRGLKIKFELMCRADTVTAPGIRRLKSVGLQRVFLGLESMDAKQLQRYGKRVSVRQNLKAIIILNKFHVAVIASVILADAFTSLKDLLRQFIFLFELRRRYFKSKNCRISVNKKLEIYRGSAVYQEYKNKKLLTRDDYLSGIDFKLPFTTAIRLKIFAIEEKVSLFVMTVFNALKKKNIRGELLNN